MTSRGSIASQIAAVTTLALAWLVTPAVAQNAYITNSGDSTVSVIDTTTNTVSATINVGNKPFGVAVSSDGSKVYVTNAQDGTVSVIDTATNNPTTIPNVGNLPEGIAVTPDGKKVYVANQADFTVAVIDAATNTVSTVISVGAAPFGVAVTPDGSKVYVTNSNNGVSVIATASNTVIATMPTGVAPRGVAVSPDGKKVYVGFFQEISDENPPIFLPLLGIYDTATNTVLGQIQLAFDHGPDTPFGVRLHRTAARSMSRV